MKKKNPWNSVSFKIKYFFSYTIWTPFRCMKNFFFCLKYPFWKSYNVWTGKFCGYNFTEYNTIPYGWRKAFGKQLSKELKHVIKEEKERIWQKTHTRAKARDLLCWEQIKEKYGTLRLYAATTEKIHKVLYKYEEMSKHYCINCGRPAEYETSGWIEYLCENCFLDTIDHMVFKDDQELFDYMYDCSLERIDKEDEGDETTNA